MKKTGFILKLVAAGLIFAIGLLLMIFGLDGETGFDYYGNYVDYETYGGDAYTGIQNAIADSVSAMNDTAWAWNDAIEALYMWGGILIMLTALFMVGCTLCNAEKFPKKSDHSLTAISKYKELLDSGAITQEEYDVTKAKLLGL